MYRSAAAAKRLISSSTKLKLKSKSSWVWSLYGKQSSSSYSSQQPIFLSRGGGNNIIPYFHSFGCCYNQNQNHQNRFLSTTDQIPNPNNNNKNNSSSSTSQQGTEEGVFGDNNNNNNNASSSSTTSQQGGTRRSTRANTSNYQEEQSRVLAASLPHVLKLGWSEAAMIAGARDVSLSPSIVGSIPRKEAALVEYFMDECLQKLIDEIDSGKLGLQDLVPSDRIAKLVKTRLEIQAPYISKWPQALSIQAQPLNFSTSFKQRAMLVDEFCHAASDEGTGVDWYLKRTVLAGIYSSTEIYMLTDNSTDFQDTWTFLNDRVRDAFDLKKTFQEVKYFTEAVGAGVGGSFQGFMKKGC